MNKQIIISLLIIVTISLYTMDKKEKEALSINKIRLLILNANFKKTLEQKNQNVFQDMNKTIKKDSENIVILLIMDAPESNKQ